MEFFYPITPHYRSEGRRQGSLGVFLGCVTLASYFCVCIHLIMSFVNDLAKFIAFILTREVKVYALFGTNQVGDVKIMYTVGFILSPPPLEENFG